MIWKELHVESGLRLGRLGRLLVITCVAASFVSLYLFVRLHSSTWALWHLPDVVGKWAAFVGDAVACLLLLGVAVRAATSLSGERDRQTLDGLLVTPLENSSILFAKWIGSVAGLRWGLAWLAAIWMPLACGFHALREPVYAPRPIRS
jgi:ABC-type transport system involved in multi-copper enzyme maturation permease subunit